MPTHEKAAFDFRITNDSLRDSKIDAGAWRYWYYYTLDNGIGETTRKFTSERSGSPSRYQSLSGLHRLLQELFLEDDLKVGEYYWTGSSGTEWQRNAFERGGSNTYRLTVQHNDTSMLSVMICTYSWASFGSNRWGICHRFIESWVGSPRGRLRLSAENHSKDFVVQKNNTLLECWLWSFPLKLQRK